MEVPASNLSRILRNDSGPFTGPKRPSMLAFTLGARSRHQLLIGGSRVGRTSLLEAIHLALGLRPLLVRLDPLILK